MKDFPLKLWEIFNTLDRKFQMKILPVLETKHDHHFSWHVYCASCYEHTRKRTASA